MLVQRIALERFRQLDGQEITFRPGLNLIKGPNEAGKTSLQEAILFALLGNPRHATLERKKSVEDHVTWGQDRPFRLMLHFSDRDGTCYRLEKDWDGQSTCLANLQTGEEKRDIDTVQQAIGEMLGCASLRLLQSTVCVEQDALDDISAGRRMIGDQLQSIVTGGGSDEAAVSAVLAEMDAKIAEMERGWRTHAPKNPGPIKVKRDEIDRLEERLSQFRPQVGQVEQARERLTTLGAQIEETTTQLTARQSLKTLCDRRAAWNERRDTWRAKEKELEARIEQIQSAQEQIIAAGRPNGEQRHSHLPTAPIATAVIGGLLFLAGIAIGALGWLATSEIALVLLGATAGLIGLLICTVGLVWLARTTGRSRSVDVTTAARARVDALLGERTLEEMIEERRTASRHRRDAEEALKAPEMQRAARVTPLAYEELEQEIKRLERDLDEKKTERIRCETKCEVATYSLEDVHALEEQQAAAARSLAHLEERLNVCRLARDVMQQAREQTMQSTQDELGPRVAGYLSDITRGRYERVEIDDELNMRVFSPEKEGWITPEGDLLSRGTVDQLYLAARLALLDLLYRDARPPLLLDDPFVTFDPERREQAIALCKEIARTHQVLLFTCDERYDAAADWIVELPDPS